MFVYPFNEIDPTLIAKYRNQFDAHRRSAKQRGIDFEFGFTDWLTVWHESGYLPLRGRGRGKYVMARFNDEGPYRADNVEIILNSENLQQKSKIERSLKTRQRNAAIRGDDPYRHLRRGNHPRGQRVRDEFGNVFVSAAEAAEVWGMTRQNIARRCRLGLDGWRYLDDGKTELRKRRNG